jgi:hypothetical protein
MSVLPEMGVAAIADPEAYIATLRTVLVNLIRGDDVARTSFGGEYLTFRSDDIADLRHRIGRVESYRAIAEQQARSALQVQR